MSIMKRIFAFVSSVGYLALPLVAAAQVGTGGGGTGGTGGAGVVDQFKVIADKILELVNVLVPIAFTAALLFFFWGLAKFIMAAGDPAAKEQGKNIMIWGIIALFVMASVWGITTILAQTVNIDTTITTVPVPGVK